MNIQAAILCEYASVRGGILSLLSGAITRVFRTLDEPSPLPLFLAVVLEVGPDELDHVHELRVTVSRDGGIESVGQVAAAFQPDPQVSARLHPGEPAVIPVVVPLHTITIPANGSYDVRVSADGGPTEIRTVYVGPPPGDASEG